MTHHNYDLLVIGAGSGGVRASRIAAKHGARVAICEKSRLGGTCVNLGCVPKKLMKIGSQFGRTQEHAAGFGWQFSPPHLDWTTLVDNISSEVSRLNEIYSNLLQRAGVDVLLGTATLTGPNSVSVDGKEVRATHILIATGGTPVRPNIPGSHLGITSDEAFSLASLPKRVTVIGAGYIGVEFASIFNGYGCQTTLLHRRTHPLNDSFDHDVRRFLGEELTRSGVEMHMDKQVSRISQSDNALLVHSQDGQQLETDLVLWATGRRPNSATLGVTDVGVEVNERGAIGVDDNFQTNVSSIYACGDVIDRIALTPVAIAEGMWISDHLFGSHPPEHPLSYQFIPTAVFSQPEVGTVGMTESQASQRNIPIDIFRSEFRPMKHTITKSTQRTLLKLVVNNNTDRVIGCHMVGDNASEIIQGMAIALNAGATKAVFDQTIGVHPTAAEEFVTMRQPVAPSKP